MSIAFTLLLLTAASCAVMQLVLSSLMRSGIPGIREWSAANAMALVSLPLFALRGVVPSLLSIELANGLLLGTAAALFAGVRRFFSRSVPAKGLTAGIAVTLAAVAVFHYGVDAIDIRVAIVSLFYSVCCFAIGATVLQGRDASRPRYPYLFMAGAAILPGAAYGVRAFIYGLGVDILPSLFASSFWNILFLALGILALSSLTLGAVILVHDRMLANAEHAANRDFLTGAWSRRAFFELAKRELARAARTEKKPSLLLLDVDHFKSINDGHGHAAGDQVLLDIAQRAGAVLRSEDCLARIGGEEFAVLLPETDHARARIVAERLRTVLADSQHGIVAYTVSIGFAVLRDAESLQEWMRRTDTALYEAKAAGRNLVAASPA